jgi:hypothetical protein
MKRCGSEKMWNDTVSGSGQGCVTGKEDGGRKGKGK